jgi:hypothetical protein
MTPHEEPVDAQSGVYASGRTQTSWVTNLDRGASPTSLAGGHLTKPLSTRPRRLWSEAGRFSAHARSTVEIRVRIRLGLEPQPPESRGWHPTGGGSGVGVTPGSGPFA